MPAAPLPYKIAVLCDLRDSRGNILLIHRAQEPNMGLYSMIGGKLDTASGESPAQCARREVLEEAGIDVPLSRFRLVGMVSERAYLGQTHWLMFIYRVAGHVAVPPREIREGRLEWHALDQVSRLPQPETDRQVIWPLLLQSGDSLFAVHIDCSGPEMTWSVEQLG